RVAVTVPRWEWRTFGEHFGTAESTFAALTPHQVVESDELYLISVEGEETVKVRDELMDVKRLHHVDDVGLEQWSPVMKAGFPLAVSDVTAVLTTLKVGPPSRLARASYSLDQLLEEIVRPSPDILAVDVHKRRQRYLIDGCMAELTDVRADGRSIRTIAIESK